MGIVYAPRERHNCAPPLRTPFTQGTVWRCDDCGSHWVFHDINGGRWYGEGPFSKLRRWSGAVMRRVRR